MDNLKILDSADISDENLGDIILRPQNNFEDLQYEVMEIINKVIIDGDRAVIELTKRYDEVDLKINEIKVSEDEIEEANSLIDKDLLTALKFAKQNIIKFHEKQIRDPWFMNLSEGVKLGQVTRPIESVGIYIPGGKAIYPSTVLMTAAPAYVAGVKDIVLCSPPQKNGKIAPEIIAAANLFNIKKIFKVGGVQAIASMTYGTPTIPKVLKIVGPGNKWVNTAKQLLSNYVSIDNPAGPSEILIIADETSKLDFVISDFISQLEHDPDNIGIIVTTSQKLIQEINHNLEIFVKDSKRKEIIKAASKNSLLIKVNNLEDAIRISNLIAPEHLEIMIQEPEKILNKINNAGAIFLGPYTPVPLGDYSAGTNHVLPTGGYAKTYSGLNTLTFLKYIDVLKCDKKGLKFLSDSAMKIAEFEKFDAHREAIRIRLRNFES